MPTIDLNQSGDIHVLSLCNDAQENTFTQSVMEEYLAALDEVEAHKGNTALLVRSEHEKTFSTGIDLKWMLAQSDENQKLFVLTFEQVLYRIALLNAPTVMCINGNAYAGGALITAAADFRVMRADRGRFCLPEVNINMSFPPLMMDIVQLLPNKHAIKQMTLTGIAFTGEECFARNLVDSIHPVDELQNQAIALTESLAAKNREIYTAIRNSQRTAVAQHKSALGLA